MIVDRPNPKQLRPGNAQKVFKGVLFDTYQWQQRMFDGSLSTFEQLSRPDTTEVMCVLPSGKILVTEEEQPGKPPFLSLPGGRLEPGEDPAAAALRELHEETGYWAKEISLWNAVQPVGKIDWAIFTFIARGVTKEGAAHLDAGEKITVHEMSLDEFLEAARQGRLWDHLALHAYRALAEPAYYTELKKNFGIV